MNISGTALGSSMPSDFHNVKKNSNADEAISRMAKKAENMLNNRDSVKKNNAARVNVSTYTDKDGVVHKTFSGSSTSVVDTMKKYATENKKDTKKTKKRLNYSYHKVSNQVLMAKNSVSASKAVLAARRSLSDLKRKLKYVECSEDDKAAALAHAGRMLRIAKKKKKNLEMEELIGNTMKADERNEKFKDAANQESFVFVPEDEKRKVKEFNIEDLKGDVEEEISEEMLEELAEELSDEMSEELEEMMNLMEVINPHMDKEHFEKLKTKHRCEEQKEIVKADMDYLKHYIKSVQNSGGSSPYAASNSGIVYNEAAISGTDDGSMGFSILA